MTKIEVIHDNINMFDILEHYGIKVSRGFCTCPFHDEKTASMNIKNNYFKCYGCSAHGDVIDFVAKNEQCDNKTAIKYLGEWYNLGFYTELTPAEKQAYAKRRQAETNRNNKNIFIEDQKRIATNYLAELIKTNGDIKNKNSVKKLSKLNYLWDMVTEQIPNDDKYINLWQKKYDMDLESIIFMINSMYECNHKKPKYNVSQEKWEKFLAKISTSNKTSNNKS